MQKARLLQKPRNGPFASEPLRQSPPTRLSRVDGVKLLSEPSCSDVSVWRNPFWLAEEGSGMTQGFGNEPGWDSLKGNHRFA